MADLVRPLALPSDSPRCPLPSRRIRSPRRPHRSHREHPQLFVRRRNEPAAPARLSLSVVGTRKEVDVLKPVRSSSSPKQNASRQEVTKPQQQVKTNGAGVTVLSRETSEEQQKQLQDQDQKLLDQAPVVGEQNMRLVELEHKLREVPGKHGGTLSSGPWQSEESPRKWRKAAEAMGSLRKLKWLRNGK
ncbi:F-box only protein 28 [Fukomys damarensis]|uniref:F-box only protein 28 n=1 Tax=Fukomys damarensis TaxID=885580 RepID=A0A091DQ69_FUKDA|nr:F-box only protein 28 [Fukomys damarensis]